MARLHHSSPEDHGTGPPAAGQPAARALRPSPFSLSRPAQPRAGGALEGAPRAKPGRAGAARHPDHDQRYFGGTQKYGLSRKSLHVVPAERRDPYSAASQCGTLADTFRNVDRRWLWVPAFAGTTRGECVPKPPTASSPPVHWCTPHTAT